ncbi:MAG: hypothetical protein R2708_04420 [Vicinamibacterales bacterium]
MLRTPGRSATLRISRSIDGFIRVQRRAWVHTLMVEVSCTAIMTSPRAGVISGGGDRAYIPEGHACDSIILFQC